MRRFLFILIFYSCSNDPNLVKDFIVQEELPVEEIEGAEILHTENGVLKIKITANNIKRFEGIQPEVFLYNDVEAIFFGDSGLVSSVLKAKEAEIDEINNTMTASKNVVLMSSSSKKIETEQLVWDKNNNKIYTDRRVVITTEKEIIQGEGFESTPDFSEYLIFKIHGTFNFSEKTN